MAEGNMELDPKYDHYDFPTTSVETREGHPGHLTVAQGAQVHQFRMMLEAEGFKQRLDTLTLVRNLHHRRCLYDVFYGVFAVVLCHTVPNLLDARRGRESADKRLEH